MDVERRVVADTGFVVALLNQSDVWHDAVAIAYQQHHEILLPQTVLAEVAYLVGKFAGIVTVAAFLEGLSSSRFRLVSLVEADLLRTAEILRQYADSRVDFVDASVMAVAERYHLQTVLTLDRRDFSIVVPKHWSYFTLLP